MERVIEIDGPVPEVGRWYLHEGEKMMVVLIDRTSGDEWFYPAVLMASMIGSTIDADVEWCRASDPMFANPCDPPPEYQPVRLVSKSDATVVAEVLGAERAREIECASLIAFVMPSTQDYLILPSCAVAKLASAIRKK